jgi:hypothetical protein
MKSIAQWAIASMLLFITGLTLNYFREPLLGYREGSAAHNFSFNVMFFFPLMLTSLFISIIVLSILGYSWKKFQDVKTRIIVFSCSIPIIFLFVFQVVRVFRNT